MSALAVAAAVRDRPILFSGPMVRAILAGTKTQTRRLCKGARERSCAMDWPLSTCPYGRAGDRLWVRETFRQSPGSMSVHYAADPDEVSGGPWRPSIFMPRWASRIQLEVTEVRVQRLQEISEEDAIAEGMDAESLAGLLYPLAAKAKPLPPHWINGADNGESYCRECGEKAVALLKTKNPDINLDGGWGGEEDGPLSCETCGALLDFHLTDYGAKEELDHFSEYGISLDPGTAFHALAMVESGACKPGPLARVGFRFTWEGLNGKRAPWESNPWVWAITFKRVE